ncbi:MAG: PEP-CTERM sorting domain-containing protein [Akkermansia sp.]|nr:PEP-CTERM sorting domain-containing protein [Akkermansia sp.]
MKKTLFLLAALGVTSGAHAAVGDTVDLSSPFVADGVAATAISGPNYTSVSMTSSTRFYDSTKGWVVSGDYIGDNNMCWAHSASNMLQYWQSYYGVFCKDDRTPIYGSYDNTYETYPYSPAVSQQIANPLKLNMMKHIVNSGWKNTSNAAKSAFDWYFTWNPSSSAGAGYYREYFGTYSTQNGQPTTCTLTDLSGTQTVQSLTDALLPAMGVTEKDGTYVQTEAGLIANFIVTSGGSSAHALTCYGFTLDESGKLTSIIYADSDNSTYTEGGMPEYVRAGLQQVFVSDKDGALYMYEDAACTKLWKFQNQSADYWITSVTGIETPEVLQNMLAEYSDTANEALVWNGGENGVWQSAEPTTEELPTTATGWDVLVNGDNIEEKHQGYYHSYAEAGRAVVFDSHGMNGSTETQVVTVTGTVSPGTITVTDGGNYHLQAGAGAAIAGSGAVSIENGGKLSSELNFGTRSITAKSGGHFAYSMTANTVLTGQISGESGSTIQFRNGSSATDVTYSYDTTNYRLASNTVNSIAGTLVIGDSQDTMATHVDFSAAYYGYMNVENLVMYGTSSLNTAGTTVVTGTYSSLKSLQAASTYNLRAAATPGPTLYDSLDLTQADTLVMETSTSLNNNSLILSTSNSLTLDMELSTTEANILFTEVGQVTVDEIANTGEKEWEASSFFSGADMQNYNLVYSAGTVALVFDPLVPEPATSTLGLVALAGLAMRRRRR